MSDIAGGATAAIQMSLHRLERPSLAIDGSSESFEVRRIYCVGRNYVEHIREMKEGDERDPPFFFQKPTDALVTDGRVPYPDLTEDLQYEVELVVAIGATPAGDSVDDALAAVFGYAVGLDMTRRDRQRESFRNGLPWEIGKSFDHSAPCGVLSPASRVGHYMDGDLRLAVNGAPKQFARLEQMIWNVPEMIQQLSRQYRLMPGDLIFSGTPAGVGALQVGDRLEGTITGLSPLHVEIVAPSRLS